MLVPERFIDIAGAVGIEHRGVVDQDRQGAEMAGRLGNDGGTLGALGKVCLEHFCLAAMGADVITDSPGALGIAAVVDDYRMASTGELFGDCRTDAVASSGNERDGQGGG